MRVYRDDQKFLTFRINALLWAIGVVFVVLAGSFWIVQGLQAEKYRGLSESNALREVVLPAKRGLIMDRLVLQTPGVRTTFYVFARASAGVAAESTRVAAG